MLNGLPVLLCGVMLLSFSEDFETHELEQCDARDCQDLRDRGFNKSGVYHVTPVGSYKGFDVYCDMETDDGGWLLFQRRKDGSVNFYRGWKQYEFGFGDIAGEHWLGNYQLHQITHQGYYELRIDLEDWEQQTAYAEYKIFRVYYTREKYQLLVTGYSGSAGDSLWKHSGSAFSTRDQDNDVFLRNCAEENQGAWWYYSCHTSNLNGPYLKGNYTPSKAGSGIIWFKWRGFNYSLKRTEMKIRRT